MVTKAEFLAANKRMDDLLKQYPHVVKAKYDAKLRRVIFELSSGAWFAFSPDDAQGLEGATASELKEIEISPTGLGVHFPRLDADLYVPGLLQGQFGSRKWMAARLGAAGGASKSKAKAAAARANGKLGGRPKKTAAR